MKKPKFNKKIILPIILGVVLVVGFFALLSIPKHKTQAQDITQTIVGAAARVAVESARATILDIPENTAKWGFRQLGAVLAGLGTLILNTAMKFFDYALTAGFDGHSEIAETGWKVSRDIANMFFILFMVVIAFATILRIERYGAKQLLPKIIIIALLINFSMVFCYVLIDFTNIAANFFISNATNNHQVQLSQIFLDGLQIPRTLTAAMCDQFLIQRDACSNLFTGNADQSACRTGAQIQYEDCAAEMASIQKTANANEDLGHVIVAQIGSAIVIFIAAFVILAGGVLMLIRSVAIWFFVIISPLAFICYILPSLRRNWETWLTQFTRWCIFAPAYAFFIWVAAKICTAESMEKIAIVQNARSTGFADRAAMVNQFFSDPQYFFGFMFISGFLIAALITANKLGIYGANIAMSVGKKWSGAATGWMKKQTVGRAKERAGGGLDRARGAAMTGAGKLFGDSKIGRSLKARGTMAQQAAAGREYNKKYATRLSMMSRDDTLKEVEKAIGTQKLLAARTAQNRGYMREATNEQAQAAMKAYDDFGDSEMLRKLEELRPDAITSKKGEAEGQTEQRRKDAEERAFSNGTYRQWGKQVLDKKKFGPQIIQEMRKQLSVGEFASVFKTWTKDVRGAAEESMQKTFTDDFAAKDDGSDNDNVANRKALYRVTNNAEKAFYQDENGGNLSEELTEIGGKAHLIARSAIIKTNAENMDRVTPDASLEYAARDITVGQVPTLGYGMQNDESKTKLKGFVAKEVLATNAKLATLRDQENRESEPGKLAKIRQRIVDLDAHLADRQKVKKTMDESEYWGGKKPEKTPPPEPKAPEKEKPDDFGKGRPEFNF